MSFDNSGFLKRQPYYTNTVGNKSRDDVMVADVVGSSWWCMGVCFLLGSSYVTLYASVSLWMVSTKSFDL